MPTIHQPYNSADTPTIHNLSLASYYYDNDCTALPIVRTTNRANTSAIYNSNRLLLLLPAAYLIRQSLLRLQHPIDPRCPTCSNNYNCIRDKGQSLRASFFEGGGNVTALMCVTWIGPSQGFAYLLAHVYRRVLSTTFFYSSS